MDSKNFTIGILSTTAVILLVGILVIHSRPAPAVASGMTETQGKYTVTVGTFTINNEEIVFVTDTDTMKMMAYRFNTAKGQIENVESIDLNEMRKATASSGGGGQQGRRRP
jgi:hypothetical protein